MPISIPYTFTQTDATLTLTFTLPLLPTSPPLTPHSVHLTSTSTHLKLSFPPSLTFIDLLHPILTPLTTHSLHPPSRTLLVHLTKSTPSSWPSLTWQGTPSSRTERRRLATEQHEAEQRAAIEKAKAARREERKEEKERGFEYSKAHKDAILELKNRERVVALSDLQQWQTRQSSPPAWQAPTGETIELIDDPSESIGQEEKQHEEEKEEGQYQEQKEEVGAPAPVRVLPPVRATVRIAALFTTVNPALPSLPARESALPPVPPHPHPFHLPPPRAPHRAQEPR